MSQRPVAILAVAGLWLATGLAHAQDVPDLKATDVGQAAAVTPPRLTIADIPDPPPPRRRAATPADPYAPLGIRTGSFILYPSLAIGGIANTNIGGAATNPRAGIGILLKPSLTFASDWDRHSWTGAASFNLYHYPSQPDLRTGSGRASTEFRLDVRRDTYALADAFYTLAQSGLGNSQVPATAVGTRADQTVGGGLALVHDFGAWQTSLRGALRYNAFGDVKLAGGGTQNNSASDYLEPLVTMRAVLTDPPLLKPYVALSADPRIYTQSYSATGVKYSSQGYGASAGFVVDDGPIWSGDIAVTYLARNYDDSSLAGIGEFGLTGLLNWSPSESTRIALSFDTAIQDAVGGSVSANRTWTADVSATQALRDNLDLLGGLNIYAEQVGGGYDVTYDASVGLLWKLGPSLAWTATYDAIWLNSASKARNYTEQRVSAAIVLSR